MFIIIWNREGFIESYEVELSKGVCMIYLDVFKQKSKKALQEQNKLRSRDRYVSVHAFIKEISCFSLYPSWVKDCFEVNSGDTVVDKNRHVAPNLYSKRETT